MTFECELCRTTISTNPIHHYEKVYFFDFTPRRQRPCIVHAGHSRSDRDGRNQLRRCGLDAGRISPRAAHDPWAGLFLWRDDRHQKHNLDDASKLYRNGCNQYPVDRGGF